MFYLRIMIKELIFGQCHIIEWFWLHSERDIHCEIYVEIQCFLHTVVIKSLKKLFFKFNLYLYIGQNHDFAWESDNIIEKKNNRISFQGFSLLKRFAMNHTNVVHYLNILHCKSVQCALHRIAFHALLQKRALERIFLPK